MPNTFAPRKSTMLQHSRAAKSQSKSTSKNEIYQTQNGDNVHTHSNLQLGCMLRMLDPKLILYKPKFFQILNTLQNTLVYYCKTLQLLQNYSNPHFNTNEKLASIKSPNYVQHYNQNIYSLNLSKNKPKSLLNLDIFSKIKIKLTANM